MAREMKLVLTDDFDGTVVVTARDVPLLRSDTLQELLDAHLDTEPAAVTVLTTTVSEPTGYGRIVRTTDGDVAAIVEEKDASPMQRAIQEINTGVYAFDVAALRSALGKLSDDNSQGELYLTDVVKIARGEGRTVRGVHTDDAVQVSGVNDRVQLAALSTELNRRLLEHWMREGVTVIDPASTWIDVDVVLGTDVTIHPGVQLRGRTVIADDAEVGPDTTLTDVQVGAGATVVRRRPSVRSPTCVPAPNSARAASSAPSSRRRTRRSGRIRRSPTSPMSATRRSASTPTSERRACSSTTTG